VLRAMLYAKIKFIIFLSRHNGFDDAIEKALEKPEFSDLTVTLVFGGKMASKKALLK
jgi:hypothetical protein